jgi:NADH:ubiquinone oxidoreductase subunit E
MKSMLPEECETLRRIVADMKDRPGPLIEVLHAVQATFGHVPPDAIPIVADVLNLSRAEVHGVVTFYHFFRETPPGKHTVQICRAEACQSMGADAIDSERNLALLENLCDTMLVGSLCGLGGMTPFPVQSAIKHFREDFRAKAPLQRAG